MPKGITKFERDRISRLQQAAMRGPLEGKRLPGVIEDPTNPDGLLPESAELYPAEEGGAPTGVGSTGTTPYSPEYWKKREKLPPGKSVRGEWDAAGQPEEAIPVDKAGRVKRLLLKLRRPGTRTSSTDPADTSEEVV